MIVSSALERSVKNILIFGTTHLKELSGREWRGAALMAQRVRSIEGKLTSSAAMSRWEFLRAVANLSGP